MAEQYNEYKPAEEDRKLVEQMTAVGIAQESIARVIGGGIAPKTLRKYFRDELDTAKIKANARVAGSLFNAAINGNITAAIFWAKTQMGWREADISEDKDHPVIEIRYTLVSKGEPENIKLIDGKAERIA